MRLAFQILAFLAHLYIIVLLARMVFDWLQMLARSWRPRGFVLILANVIYSLTDPPLRFLRRWVKPVRLGDVSLDLGFIILFLAAVFAQSILLRIAVSIV